MAEHNVSGWVHATPERGEMLILMRETSVWADELPFRSVGDIFGWRGYDPD